MKNRILFIFFLVFYCIELCFPLFKTFSEEKGKFDSLPSPIVRNVNSINIIIDTRIELISVIQQISNYSENFKFLLNSDDFSYKKDMESKFLPYKNHDAVEFFNKICSKQGMYNFTAPPTSMLHLDRSLNIRKDIEIDDFIMNRIGGINEFEIFTGYLKDFSIKSDFNKFFIDNKQYYEKIINNVKHNIGDIDYIKEIESFYGLRNRSYNIVLVPLYGHVGYGPYIKMKNGDKHIYNIMGPESIKDEEVMFGDEDYFKELIRHEFSHSFINPLTEKYWDLFEKYSELFTDKIPDVAKQKVCGEWQECINEHIVRAVTTYLAYRESDEKGKKFLNYHQVHRGMIFLEDILNKIRYYEQHRDIYPTFDSYYKNLADVFEKY